MLRVAYFITNHLGGMGGHFHTLGATVRAMRDRVVPLIIETGNSDAPSPALEIPDVPRVFVRQSSTSRMLAQVRAACEEFKPDVVHSFDVPACYFARVSRGGGGHVHTKCGGPNPRMWYPCVGHMIVFSGENEAWFRSRRRYRFAKIGRLPQRVGSVPQDSVACDRLRSRLNPELTTILRIGRVCSHYQSVLEGALDLQIRLHRAGAPTQLVILGSVQSPAVLRRLESLGAPETHFVTDPTFTANASRLLSVGDIVIGTGRNLLEAAILGRALLAPIRELAWPVVATADRLDRFSTTNFSPRNSISPLAAEDEWGLVMRAVADGAFRARLASDTKRMATKEFLIDGVVDQLVTLYGDAKSRARERDSVTDTVLNLAWMKRSAYRARRESANG